MWHLLKTELAVSDFYKNIPFIIMIFSALALVNEKAYTGVINVLPVIGLLFSWMHIVTPHQNRRLQHLPLSLVKVGCIRVIFLFLYWSSIYLGALLIHIFWGSNNIFNSTLWVSLPPILGIALFTHAAILICKDIPQVLSSETRHLISYIGLALTAVLAFVSSIVVIIHSKSAKDTLFLEPYTLIPIIGLGLFLSFLSVITFTKRKSYLN